ncbi:MAG: hypothetical protein WDN69_12705 [Aliidongia sp.]
MLLIGLAGCGPILQQSATPAQIQDDAQKYAQQGYLIQTGDQLLVRHLIDADYDALANVAPDGRITVPALPRRSRSAAARSRMSMPNWSSATRKRPASTVRPSRWT